MRICSIINRGLGLPRDRASTGQTRKSGFRTQIFGPHKSFISSFCGFSSVFRLQIIACPSFVLLVVSTSCPSLLPLKPSPPPLRLSLETCLPILFALEIKTANLFSSAFRRFPFFSSLRSSLALTAAAASPLHQNSPSSASALSTPFSTPLRVNSTSRMVHSKVVIIGSGPAAHTAAIYLSRAELQPVLYEGMLANGTAAGGQLTTTTDIENFPGFPDGIGGSELMDNMRKQSIRFGTEVITETISRLDLSQRPFKLWTEWNDGPENEPARTADAVIIATGANARRLDLPGEETYWQNGISACAVCDGAVPIFRNKPLFVIGGGDSAAEEAMFLAKYGSGVTVLVRRDKLRASKAMANRLLSHPKVKVRFNSVATEVLGENKPNGLMTHLRVKDTVTGAEEVVEANGLFYAVGHDPANNLVKGQIELDEDGYIKTKPGSTITSLEGVFACGDVQDKRYRQAITSAGSGCMAALDAEKFISEGESHEEPAAANPVL
ncbi:thioredoxin reductase [Aspergillus rambellii]|uniref:Thioredoxin reductase n=3 Tax=Aspergillus subgen. Nidulantes TaxID=2720870 RepID=A0A0F8X9I8_9EURO|nr:thioredoxin reductase [Aspergillus ochraceoroseus]KKK26205.1 thioredoxin reductase [Aspergillus rambellii]